MKKKILPVLFFSSFMILGAVFGFLFSKKDAFAGNSLLPIFALLSLALAVLVQIIVHEFGHLLFGKLSGMGFYSFRIFFLAIEKENQQLKIKFHKNLGYAGLCIMIPGKTNSSPKNLIAYMAGGLVMNLLSFTISLVLIFSVPMQQGFISYFIYSTAFTSLLLFLMNAWPQKNEKNITTDGRYILDAMNENADSRHLADLFVLNAASFSGTDPSVFFPSYLNRHEAIDSTIIKINFLVYQYYYFLHEGKNDGALAAMSEIEQHLDSYPQALLKELQKELLFVSAYLKPDVQKAKKLFELVKNSLGSGGTVNDFRIYATYALHINHDKAHAAALIIKGKAVADSYIMKSFIPMEKSLLTAIMP